MKFGWNIKIDLKGMGLEGVGWIHLAQDVDQWQAVVKMGFMK
jgi:hypothetical protein